MNATTAPPTRQEPPGGPRRWFRLPSAVRRARTALRASEPHPRTVWVVAFAPADGRHAVGGFEWRTDWEAADALYEKHVTDSIACGGSHEVRFLPYRSALDGEDLTRAIDADLGLIEADEFGNARRFVPTPKR